MILHNVCSKHDLDRIHDLYLKAFPANERKPFAVILQKCQEGSMEILKIEDIENSFVGLVIMILYKDLAILDYFAIDETMRNRGFGSQILSLLNKRYTDKRMILEIENPDVPSDNTRDRIRRKGFYLRNHMILMPFRVDLFGVDMLILTNGKPVTFEEYHEIFVNVFSPMISNKIHLIK